MADSKLLFVLSQAPAAALAAESLDALMTALLLGQASSALLLADGLDQLSDPALQTRFAMLHDLGSLRLIALGAERDEWAELDFPVEALDEAALPHLFASHERVLAF